MISRVVGRRFTRLTLAIVLSSAFAGIQAGHAAGVKPAAASTTCVGVDGWRIDEGIFVNVTVTEPDDHGWINVHRPLPHPASAFRLANSSVNFAPGQTVANTVWVMPDEFGRFCVSASASTHFVADVVGYAEDQVVSAASQTGSADRVIDTRDGVKPAAGSTTCVQGHPPDGEAPAVLVNITVTEPDDHGWINVHHPDAVWDANSSANFAPHQTVANMVLAFQDQQGRFCISPSASTHFVVDIVGSVAAGGEVRPATPMGSAVRLIDTRDGPKPAIGSTTCLDSQAGQDQVAFVNVTVTEPDEYGWVNVHHPDALWDANSSVNFAPHQTIANMVVATRDASGRFCVSTSVSTHFVVDVIGYSNWGQVRQARPDGSADRVIDTREPPAVDDEHFIRYYDLTFERLDPPLEHPDGADIVGIRRLEGQECVLLLDTGGGSFTLADCLE